MRRYRVERTDETVGTVVSHGLDYDEVMARYSRAGNRGAYYLDQDEAELVRPDYFRAVLPTWAPLEKFAAGGLTMVRIDRED